MLKGLRAWIAGRREKYKEDRDAQVHEPVFYDERTTTDTVVFVHGIIGDYRTTWRRFPELLRHDPEIPRTDLLLWGYRSSLLPTDEVIQEEAKRLMSDTRQILPNAQHIFFVGHSMGGLAILGGLVHELINNRADEIPVRVARHITLYATPVLGSQVAAILKLTIGSLPKWRFLLPKQVRDLAPGPYVNNLIREVANRIYSPTVAAGETASKHRIPITACIGQRDLLVSPDSANGVFDKPAPVLLDASHTSIKEPDSRDDRRYLPVRNILVSHYGPWFYRMAETCLDNPNPNAKRAARVLFERCEHALEYRLQKFLKTEYDRKDAKQKRELKLQLLRIAIALTRELPDQSMGTLLNLALDDL